MFYINTSVIKGDVHNGSANPGDSGDVFVTVVDVHKFSMITGDVHAFAAIPLLRQTMMMSSVIVEDVYNFITPFLPE